MASGTPSSHPPAWREPLNLALFSLVLYTVLFFVLTRYVPASRRWYGLPQAYFMLVSLVVLRVGHIKFADIGLSFKSLPRELLYGALVALIPTAVVVRYLWATPIVPGESGFGEMAARFVRYATRNPSQLYHLTLLVILAPFSEELFFRGTLAKLLQQRLPKAVVVPLVAALFAAAHFVWQPGPFLLGIGATWLFVWRGSIIPGLLLHAWCNALGPLLIVAAPEVYAELRIFFL